MDPLVDFNGAVVNWPELQQFGRVLESTIERFDDRHRFQLTIERPGAAPVSGVLAVMLRNHDCLRGETAIDRANVVLQAFTEWMRTHPAPIATFDVTAHIADDGAVVVR